MPERIISHDQFVFVTCFSCSVCYPVPHLTVFVTFSFEVLFLQLFVLFFFVQLQLSIFCYSIGLKVSVFLLCNRYWVIEMHVDGFRFDLASIMTRGSRLVATLIFMSLYSVQWCLFWVLVFSLYLRVHLIYIFLLNSLWDAVNVFGSPIEGDLLTTGTPLGTPPLIDMISNDPILHGVKVLLLGFCYIPPPTLIFFFVFFCYHFDY